MIQTPPRQVLVDGVGWHNAIDPAGYIQRGILSDVPVMCIDEQYLAEDIAGVAASRLHERDSPVRMETVVKLKRRVRQSAIGVATQVDVTQQVLVEDGSGQVGEGVSLADAQLRRSLRVFRINHDETGRRGVGE